MSVLTGSLCAVHATNEATRTCGRCGAFACAECTVNPFYPDHCPACVERVAGKASTRAMMSVAFAGLSIGCYCLPLGFVAAFLGHSELQAISRGESSEAGRAYAQAARIVGIITGALTVVAVVLLGVGFLTNAFR